MIQVEIWTDIICPWCGLGRHRLAAALERFGHAGEIELRQRSFQLDENAPAGPPMTVRRMLSETKGLTNAQIDQIGARIESLARSEGLNPYVVLDNRVANTSLAHELAAWATDLGQGQVVWQALYDAYFREARSVFGVDALVELAVEVGLDPDEARKVLISRSYSNRIREEARQARELGAKGVPFVVIDRRFAVSGAQSVDRFLEVLEAARRARLGADSAHPPAKTPTSTAKATACDARTSS